MQRIAIIGTGKLSFAITLGFLRAISLGMLDAKLIIIGRSKENLEKFNSLSSEKIITTTKYENIWGAQYCIICILPTGVQELYPKLQKVFEKFRAPKTVISLTSGLNTMQAKNLLNVFHSHMVCGTTTTNVAYGLGYSVFTGIDGNNSSLPKAVELFNCLGKTSITKGYKNVLKSIPLVGSGNAFDTTFLSILSKYERGKGSRASHENRLKNLRTFFSYVLHGGNLEYLQNSRTRLRKGALGYIEAKLEYMTLELGYEQNFALKLILENLILTIGALLENPLTEGNIQAHIARVATPGGCTEKGILELECVLEKVFTLNLREPDYREFKRTYRMIMRPVYRRTVFFQKEARTKLS